MQAQQGKQKLNHDKRAHEPQEFQEGEVVRIKNFPNSYPRYVKGQIVQKLGPYHYHVKIGARIRVVHLEQIRSTGELDIESNDLPDLPDCTFPDVSLPHTLPPALFQQCSQPSGSPVGTPKSSVTRPSPRVNSSSPEPVSPSPVARDDVHNQSHSAVPRRNPVRARMPRQRMIEEM